MASMHWPRFLLRLPSSDLHAQKMTIQTILLLMRPLACWPSPASALLPAEVQVLWRRRTRAHRMEGIFRLVVILSYLSNNRRMIILISRLIFATSLYAR